ncbi:hypothetical protein G6F24_012838 [Rhizopus arrhizus]|nr:hypothetical protein G6F24_012838 [Rhizopus arrhizus]
MFISVASEVGAAGAPLVVLFSRQPARLASLFFKQPLNPHPQLHNRIPLLQRQPRRPVDEASGAARVAINVVEHSPVLTVAIACGARNQVTRLVSKIRPMLLHAAALFAPLPCIVRTLQARYSRSADLRHQVDPVVHDVSRLVVVAWGALLVDVVLVEPQLGMGADGAVMPGVILPVMKAPTTNAGAVPVAPADELVECGLSLSQVVCTALQLLFPNLDLAALALLDRFALLLLLLPSDDNSALWAAPRLKRLHRDEGRAARRHCALLRPGLPCGQRHATSRG